MGDLNPKPVWKMRCGPKSPPHKVKTTSMASQHIKMSLSKDCSWFCGGIGSETEPANPCRGMEQMGKQDCIPDRHMASPVLDKGGA